METIEQRVKKIIVDSLGVDAAKVTTDAMLVDDLGAESLDIIEIEMMAEEEFDLEDDDQVRLELELNMTVGDVIRVVEERVAGRG